MSWLHESGQIHHIHMRFSYKTVYYVATLRVTLQSSTSEVPKLQLQNLLISVEFRRLLYRQIHILVVAHHEKHQVVKQFLKSNI